MESENDSDCCFQEAYEIDASGGSSEGRIQTSCTPRERGAAEEEEEDDDDSNFMLDNITHWDNIGVI